MRRSLTTSCIVLITTLAWMGCEKEDASETTSNEPEKESTEAAEPEAADSDDGWGRGRQTLPSGAPFKSPYMKDTDIPEEQTLDELGKKLRAMTFEQETDGWDAVLVSPEDFEGCSSTNPNWQMSAEDIAEQKQELLAALKDHEITGYSADDISEVKSPVKVFQKTIEGKDCSIEARATYNVQHGIEDGDNEVGLYEFDLYLVGSNWKIYGFDFDAKDCDKKFVGNQRFCQSLNIKE